jgi:hypothetical protein
MDAITKVPQPFNEPVHDYDPMLPLLSGRAAPILGVRSSTITTPTSATIRSSDNTP